MRKLEHWDARLTEWASAQLRKPFVWGERDCALLALEAVDAMAGTAMAELHRGQYHDEHSALAYQARIESDLATWLRAKGLEEHPPGYQQRGDILVVARNGFACGHICFGARVLDVWPEHGVAWGYTRDVMAHHPEVLRIPGG